MSVVRFSNSTNILGGMLLSSSPQFQEMSRVVRVSQDSTEDTFSTDVERELFSETSRQYILDIEPSDQVYRLDEEIVRMEQQQIEGSTDDLSRLIMNVWNQ